MVELAILIVVALIVFSSILATIICINSSRISEEEREAEFKIACKRAKEIWNRSHNKDV